MTSNTRYITALVASGEATHLLVGGLAWLLQNEPDPSRVASALKHLRVAIDEPIADWWHLRAQADNRLVSFREIVDRLPRGRVAPVIAAVRQEAGAFVFDPAEAYAKVVSIYTLDYSNFMPYAPAVRARFMRHPREVQESFLATFLELYEEGTDVTHLKGADDAAAWIRSVRRFRGQWTVELRAPVAAPPLAELDAELHISIAELSAALERPAPEFAYIASCLRDIAKADVIAAHPLAHVLGELEVPQPRRVSLTLAFSIRHLIYDGSLPTELRTLQERLQRACAAALAWGW